MHLNFGKALGTYSLGICSPRVFFYLQAYTLYIMWAYCGITIATLLLSCDCASNILQCMSLTRLVRLFDGVDLRVGVATEDFNETLLVSSTALHCPEGRGIEGGRIDGVKMGELGRGGTE